LLCASARAEHSPFLFKGSPCKPHRVQVNGNIASVLDYMPHHSTYLYNQSVYWILKWRYYEHCISECCMDNVSTKRRFMKHFYTLYCINKSRSAQHGVHIFVQWFSCLMLLLNIACTA
jgi:hypothetical protein